MKGGTSGNSYQEEFDSDARYLFTDDEAVLLRNKCVNHYKHSNNSIFKLSNYEGIEFVCFQEADDLKVFAIDKRKPIGKGAEGTVYVAQLLQNNKKNSNNELCVVKVSNSQKLIDCLENEHKILKILNRDRGSFVHVNYDTQPNTKTIYVFNELQKGKNLIDLCYSKAYPILVKSHIEHSLLIKIMKAILEEVKALHHAGILHRDIKIENIIIDINGDSVKARFVDFSQSCHISESTKVFTGTIGYQAPEMSSRDSRHPFNTQNDYFSIGIIFASMLSELPYELYLESLLKKWREEGHLNDFTNQHLIEAFADVLISDVYTQSSPLSYLNSIVVDIVKFLIHPDPNKRPIHTDIDKMIRILSNHNVFKKDHLINPNFSEEIPDFKPFIQSRNVAQLQNDSMKDESDEELEYKDVKIRINADEKKGSTKSARKTRIPKSPRGNNIIDSNTTTTSKNLSLELDEHQKAEAISRLKQSVTQLDSYNYHGDESNNEKLNVGTQMPALLFCAQPLNSQGSQTKEVAAEKSDPDINPPSDDCGENKIQNFKKIQ